MIVGFTGTRHGMTDEQCRRVRKLLIEWGAIVLHHGDCQGADAQAHAIAGDLGLKRVAHPPSDSRLRAFCSAEETRVPKPYLVRDQDIVHASDHMIAAPLEDIEQDRGGTWATIRMARRAHKECAIVSRDGTVVYEYWF